MSEGKPGKLAEQIICWISIALCHGNLSCCTQSLPADAELKILFFGQLAMLSPLQCVRKAPHWIEVLGSSSHLLMLSRVLLKDGIGWGSHWAVVGKGRESWNILLSSLSPKSRNPDLQGIWANVFLTLLSTVPLIPHSAGSAVPRFCSCLVCQGCCASLPLLPWQVRVADSSPQGCGSSNHRGLQVGSISMESLFHENTFICWNWKSLWERVEFYEFSIKKKRHIKGSADLRTYGVWFSPVLHIVSLFTIWQSRRKMQPHCLGRILLHKYDWIHNIKKLGELVLCFFSSMIVDLLLPAFDHRDTCRFIQPSSTELFLFCFAFPSFPSFSSSLCVFLGYYIWSVLKEMHL